MKRNRRIKMEMKTLTFILIVLFSSMFMIFPMNSSDSETNLNEINYSDEVNNILPEPLEIIGSPHSSKISNAPWWNGSWRYRQLINVTNPNINFAFTNYTTTLVFNYTTQVANGTMNGDLSDIRIVQNGVLRKYYYLKDYPKTDFVTVWFDIDIGKSPNHIDTDNVFLYFNGSGIYETVDPDYYMDESKASNNTRDAMGWIRNGNFELDGESGQKLTTEVFGWTYTNAAPSSFDSNGELEESTNYMHELTEENSNQTRTFGNWSFKWGELGDWILTETTPDPPAEGHDFEGTLYTYPFVVPKVEGIGVNLQLEVYRNFRCYASVSSHEMGFYIRLCESYSSNVNDHNQYILKEKYDITSQPGGTTVSDGSFFYDTRNDVIQPFSNDGEVTGKISINLDSDDWGKLLFLQVGTYGKESTKQTAFAQVDNVSFNYELNTALNEEIQVAGGEVSFITKDVDGRIVPNAEVTINRNYGTYIERGPYLSSEEDGSVSFYNVENGYWNVTVNYTIPGLEEVVYNSSTTLTEYFVDSTGPVYELMLNMSTIDFEILDSGGYPLTYGYINVSYDQGGAALDILQLQNDGKATFRWLNRSYYYYQVYYNNTDYSPNPTPLNASYIWRDNYANYPVGDKHQFHTLDINVNNQAPPSGQYNVKQRIYTNNSMTQISNIKLINLSISIQNNEFLKNVSVYYIDSSDNTDTMSHRIFFDDSYVGETGDNITIDLMRVFNSKLSSENRLAYGLLIDVWGVNSSICTGDIEVNMTEAWHILNRTGISKLNIRVLGDGATLSDAIVTIKSNSTILGNSVNTTLISDKNRDSFAFSTNDLPFMFLNGYYYNFSVRWESAAVQDTFNVSGPDPSQWAPNTYVGWYNYSLLKYNFTLEFDIDMGTIDPSEYKLKFENLTSPESVVWENNVTVQVYFNKTEDNWGTYSNVTAPDSIQLKIQLATQVLFTFNMINIPGSPGYYKIEFNSSILSAGIAGVFYRLVITGSKSPYTLQGDEITTLFVNGKGTNLTLHDYYNSLNVITEFSQNYGELVNISTQYYNNSNSPLKGATITYEWLGLAPVQLNEDPINDGYYYTTIDTSIAGSWGVKTLRITASLENYSTQVIITSLNLNKRPTKLNGTTILFYKSQDVWVNDAYNFTFEYIDSLTNFTISGLEVATYTWQELDAEGNPVVGSSGSGTLTPSANNTYSLDFDTEVRSVGYYYLYINLQKQNYEERAALINLEIKLREFQRSFIATSLTDSQISVAKGTAIELEISLIDTSRGNIALENATVTLTLSGKIYNFDETSPGVYKYTFPTANIDTFFSAQTFTSRIDIQMVNFTSKDIDITIVVGLEEIFPGMPTFYFILIIISAVGIIGSLIGYRVIQQARIPKFVKKVRKSKDLLKSGKLKREAMVFPTKEEMIISKLGENWKELDLSLEDTLGIQKDGAKKIGKIKEKPVMKNKPEGGNK
jgi:hypothetical protein